MQQWHHRDDTGRPGREALWLVAGDLPHPEPERNDECHRHRPHGHVSYIALYVNYLDTTNLSLPRLTLTLLVLCHFAAILMLNGASSFIRVASTLAVTAGLTSTMPVSTSPLRLYAPPLHFPEPQAWDLTLLVCLFPSHSCSHCRWVHLDR